MKCPNCGYENVNGKFCAECGVKLTQSENVENILSNDNKSDKKNSMKIINIIALILACIPCTWVAGLLLSTGLVIICIKAKEKKTLPIIALCISLFWFGIWYLNKDDIDVVGNKISSSSEVAESTSEKDLSTNNNDLSVGDSYEYDGLKVTVNSVNADFQEYDNDWNKPKDGYKYVEANITYENTSEKDSKYVSIYDYDCYADNTLCDAEYSLDDSDFINANISAGRNVTFSIYFLVPEDAQSIELEYNDNSLWSNLDTNIKIIIQ